ncbi:MAG: sugar ABC transporter permease, partial [Bacillota bacterium]
MGRRVETAGGKPASSARRAETASHWAGGALRLRLTIGQRQALWAYTFLAVPLAFFVWIRFYPALFAFNVSVRQWSILSPDRPFVGFQNFVRMWQDPVFWKALANTGLYVLVGVPATLLIGLTIALLIHRITLFAGLYRMIYFVPYVTSAVAVAWVWRWMYAPSTGVFNEAMLRLGLPMQGFLRDPGEALLSIAAAIVWQFVGFQVVIFL